MKKFYKQLTKVIAVVALLLIGSVNASAAESWNAYGGNTNVSVTISTSYATTFVTNLQAKADQQITYSYTHGETQTKIGVRVPPSNKLYLKPTTDGFLNIRFACEDSSSPLTVTIHDNTTNRDVASVDVVTPTVTYVDYGETVLFEVVGGHEYVLNASDGRTYYFVGVNKIESSEAVELSEEMTASEMSSAIGSGITVVIMHRPITAGIWNTFSSPIKLGPNAMKAELKCEVAYEMQSYNASNKTITFKSSDHIDANKPYLIKPSEGNSVLIVSNRSNPASYNPQTVTSNGLSFKAALGATNIYTTGDENSTKLFLNKSGKLVYPTSNEGNKGMIKGFRAYFEIPSAGLVKDFVFEDEDDPTGIIHVEQDIFNENGRIYSVDGRYVGDSKESLSRGIYIQNGRKFIVK